MTFYIRVESQVSDVLQPREIWERIKLNDKNSHVNISDSHRFTLRCMRIILTLNRYEVFLSDTLVVESSQMLQAYFNYSDCA